MLGSLLSGFGIGQGVSMMAENAAQHGQFMALAAQQAQQVSDASKASNTINHLNNCSQLMKSVLEKVGRLFT